MSLLQVPEDVHSSVHLAVIRLDPSPELHLRVFEGLQAAGIGVQLHYTPVHLQPYYCRLGLKRVISLRLRPTQLMRSVSLYPGLQEEDQLRVFHTLASLLVS